jgi:hypothetical protein
MTLTFPANMATNLPYLSFIESFLHVVGIELNPERVHHAKPK